MEQSRSSEITVQREEVAAWEARLAAALHGGAAGAPIAELPFLQLPAWAANKSLTGWSAARLVALAPNGSWAGAQFLIRRLPAGLGAIAYAPRGPLVVATDEALAARLRAALLGGLGALRADGVTLVRIEPGETRVLVEGDDQVTPPESATGPLRAPWIDAARAAGVALLSARPVQPRSSRRIDLARGIDAVRADWRRTSAASARKATEAGATMRVGGVADAEAFRGVMLAIAGRTGVKVRSGAAFAHLIASLNAAPSAGASELRSGGEFAIAESAEGRVVGALLLATTATTTTEIFGGATDEGNAIRVPYLLKAYAIERAVALGSRTYDMWGISTQGIAEFKAAWGGTAYAYPGGFDVVINSLRGRLARAALDLRGFGG